jgi:hypothetical protein
LVSYKFGIEDCSCKSLTLEDEKTKVQLLPLAKDCYSMKLELLTNATVVDDAIRFVSEKSKDKGSSKPTKGDNSILLQNRIAQRREVIYI